MPIFPEFYPHVVKFVVNIGKFSFFTTLFHSMVVWVPAVLFFEVNEVDEKDGGE